MLTPHQRRVYDVIVAFNLQHGRPPIYRELTDELGIVKSTLAAYAAILRRKGFLRENSLRPTEIGPDDAIPARSRLRLRQALDSLDKARGWPDAYRGIEILRDVVAELEAQV